MIQKITPLPFYSGISIDGNLEFCFYFKDLEFGKMISCNEGIISEENSDEKNWVTFEIDADKFPHRDDIIKILDGNYSTISEAAKSLIYKFLCRIDIEEALDADSVLRKTGAKKLSLEKSLGIKNIDKYTTEYESKIVSLCRPRSLRD